MKAAVKFTNPAENPEILIIDHQAQNCTIISHFRRPGTKIFANESLIKVHEVMVAYFVLTFYFRLSSSMLSASMRDDRRGNNYLLTSYHLNPFLFLDVMYRKTLTEVPCCPPFLDLLRQKCWILGTIALSLVGRHWCDIWFSSFNWMCHCWMSAGVWRTVFIHLGLCMTNSTAKKYPLENLKLSAMNNYNGKPFI